jgi:SAM-dependent methyltransferase
LGRFVNLRHGWLFRCGQCGLLASSLTPHIPSEVQSTSIDEERRMLALADIRRRNNNILLDHIERVIGPQSKDLLDVGSGLGFFLSDAKARGFKVLGIEPDATVVDKARATGVPTRQGYFPDCIAGGEAFDVIVFNDVLEHLPALTETLDACTRHLKWGGLLVLNCPNQRGFFYRAADILDRLRISGPFDRMWQRGLASPHVWYFEPHHLRRLGNRHNLGCVDAIELLPLSLRGLTHRIFYVRDQSKLMGVLTLIAVLTIVPILSLLPRDTAIVILQKKSATP